MCVCPSTQYSRHIFFFIFNNEQTIDPEAERGGGYQGENVSKGAVLCMSEGVLLLLLQYILRMFAIPF